MSGSGRLTPSTAAPQHGEDTIALARAASFTVEQILSGELSAPQDYEQDHDEWVVVLEGGAVLEVGGVARDLGPGDWVMLPARAPHRLVRTQPGTSWLAVRATG